MAVGSILGGFVFAVASLALAGGAGETRVREDLERYLRARTDASDARIDLPPLASFVLPPGVVAEDLKTRFSSRADPPFVGRVAVKVELFAGSRLIRRGIVSPYIRIVEDAYVPARDLVRGAVLTADDLKRVKRDRTRLPGDAIDRPASVVGLRMKRNLREGNVLRRAHVERIPVVERGDRVTLVLESGVLQILGKGKAQQAGATGDWIRVVNLDSRREISGRVDREGRVHVAF